MPSTLIDDSRGTVAAAPAAGVATPRRWACRRPWVAAVRATWAGLILLSVALFTASLPYRYDELRTFTFPRLAGSDIMRVADPVAQQHALAQLGLPSSLFVWSSLALEIVFAATFCTVAAVIAARRHNSWWTMFVALMLAVFGTSALPTMNALASTYPLVDLLTRIFHMLGWALVELFLFLFPNGRFVPRWTNGVAAIFAAWLMAMAIFPDSFLSAFTWPDPPAYLLWVGMYGGGMLSQLIRYVRYSDQVARWQTKWTLYSVVIAVVGTLAVNLPRVMDPALMRADTGAVLELIRIPVSALFILAMPLTVGVAIRRYRLWEIDLLINRTLVYLPLTAILGGLYTAGIGLSQRLFVALTGSTSDGAIVLTTLVVASAFTPIKNGLQGTVDGHFKRPAGAAGQLQLFRQQLQAVLGVLDTRAAVSRLLHTAAAALAAEAGAVYLRTGDELALVETVGGWPRDATLSVPLEWGGAHVGHIALCWDGTRPGVAEAELAELRQAAASIAHLAVLRGASSLSPGAAATPGSRGEPLPAPHRPGPRTLPPHSAVS